MLDFLFTSLASVGMVILKVLNLISSFLSFSGDCVEEMSDAPALVFLAMGALVAVLMVLAKEEKLSIISFFLAMVVAFSPPAIIYHYIMVAIRAAEEAEHQREIARQAARLAREQWLAQNCHFVLIISIVMMAVGGIGLWLLFKDRNNE